MIKHFLKELITTGSQCRKSDFQWQALIMTDQISTLHLKQRVTFTFVCSVFLFYLSAPIEIPRTKVLLYVNYLCEFHLKSHTTSNNRQTTTRGENSQDPVKSSGISWQLCWLAINECYQPSCNDLQSLSDCDSSLFPYLWLTRCWSWNCGDNEQPWATCCYSRVALVLTHNISTPTDGPSANRCFIDHSNRHIAN